MTEPHRTPQQDTIAAIATAAGRSAIAVLRLSGLHAHAIAARICGPLPLPRNATLRSLRDRKGELIDRGLVLVFAAPQSYTGEDCVEFQTHGGRVVLTTLMEEICAQGARLARPGEFTERAFLNDRIDLVQAEAVADLIDAHSRAGARAALRSLEGDFSRTLRELAQALLDLRVWVEGALDFVDEDVEWLSDDRLHTQLSALRTRLSMLLQRAASGYRLRQGMTVAIAGAPNVGKSTLMNRLSRRETAIVTDIPGTTRDLLQEQLLIGDLPITLIDMAGLRSTNDPIEQEGIRRAWVAVGTAELILHVVDDRSGLTAEDRGHQEQLPTATPCWTIYNKCDLSGRAAARFSEETRQAIRLSAYTGEGLALLETGLQELAGVRVGDDEVFVARARHLQQLRLAMDAADTAAAQLAAGTGAELVAEELRRAHDAVGEITGAISSDALLGEIFARFCIGK